MRFIDLHVHTTASDGSFTPSEVCQMALDKGLAALAITDHDTVDGVPKQSGSWKIISRPRIHRILFLWN